MSNHSIMTRLYDLLRERFPLQAEEGIVRVMLTPNPGIDWVELRESLIRSILIWGKCAAWVIPDSQGMLAELWPLEVSQLKQPDGVGGCEYTCEGTLLKIPRNEIMVIN